MRLASIRIDGREEAAVVTGDGLVPVSRVNAGRDAKWPTSLQHLIEQGLSPRLLEQAAGLPALDASTVSYAPLYRHPRKIWGIGLNYLEHAQDLGAPHPTEPASFIKGEQTIIGPGDEILLPPQSQRVTAEGELGIVIGRTCRFVSPEDAGTFVAGVCLVIDMTAEDILQRNPRFLTRSKNFDTFFSFGPELITLDEIPNLLDLEVGTYLNGELHRKNVVSDMAFPPLELVAFHSHVATLFPGDVISTGTPGAVVIEDGDVAECRIGGLGALANPVRRLPPYPGQMG